MQAVCQTVFRNPLVNSSYQVSAFATESLFSLVFVEISCAKSEMMLNDSSKMEFCYKPCSDYEKKLLKFYLRSLEQSFEKKGQINF